MNKLNVSKCISNRIKYPSNINYNKFNNYKKFKPPIRAVEEISTDEAKEMLLRLESLRARRNFYISIGDLEGVKKCNVELEFWCKMLEKK